MAIAITEKDCCGGIQFSVTGMDRMNKYQIFNRGMIYENPTFNLANGTSLHLCTTVRNLALQPTPSSRPSGERVGARGFELE
jgi:hypothetical protein